MLDKILFWVVLAWMVAMLVMAFLAIREVWRECSKPGADGEPPDATPPAKPKTGSTPGQP